MALRRSTERGNQPEYMNGIWSTVGLTIPHWLCDVSFLLSIVLTKIHWLLNPLRSGHDSSPLHARDEWSLMTTALHMYQLFDFAVMPLLTRRSFR